jgi:hypothetical protein
MAYIPELTDGSAITGRSITATLYVSPDGDDTNGTSWDKAYTTIQGALDAASTGANDCTLIMIAPKETSYDINTTGDPTWSGNYILTNSHRNWSRIGNTHASATSVMKFTGKISLVNTTIDCGTSDVNGVIISGSGAKGAMLDNVYFECEDVTGAQTALEISGGTEYIKCKDLLFHGTQAYTTGMLINDGHLCEFKGVEFHDCLKGLQITNADSDSNTFRDFLFHTCTIGMDIDAGNGQIFKKISFYDCTRNIDDEVGDHQYEDLNGDFPIYVYPDDFTGIAIASDGTADTWGALTDIVAASAIDNPFRIVGVTFNPQSAVSQYERVRFTADNGTIYYDDLLYKGDKREVGAAPSGTEFIFNADTRIQAQCKTISAGPDTVNIWIEIQEI